MKRSHLIGALCAGFFSFVTQSSHAALIDRGGGLIYDDVLNVTWTENAGLNGSVIHWDEATTWANGLVFGGSSNWRLPNMDLNGDTSVVDCSSASEIICRDNELGYMAYYNIGGTFPFSGDQTVGDVTITNIASDYWSSTAASSSEVWIFNFDAGVQTTFTVSSGPGNAFSFAWAVADGDISAVPLPTAVWLFGSGLLGFVSMARCKKA